MSSHLSSATQPAEGSKLGPGSHPLAEVFSLLAQDDTVMWAGEEAASWHCHTSVADIHAQSQTIKIPPPSARTEKHEQVPKSQDYKES